MARKLRLMTATAVAALAFAFATAAFDVPYLAGRVNDYAGMLDDGTRGRLEAKLAQLEKATGDQVVVLTIESLGGEPLEDYSIKVAQTWKLGQKGKDNGVLLLIAKDDRKMRLEVGYGLEASLTDALSSRILNNVVRPRFKAGDFAGGIAAGVDAIVGTLEGRNVVPAEPPASPVGGQNMPLPARLLGLLIFSVVVGLFSLVALFGKGCQSWFLYVFLMPFYAAFPFALLGPAVGWLPIVLWVVGFPILRLLLGRTPWGKTFLAVHPGLVTFATSSGRSSGGGSSSGGFSGGGGSFGGGGASSGW
ncbi:MAG: TPM domain-containing protein [Acidobacteriota bacterium]